MSWLHCSSSCDVLSDHDAGQSWLNLGLTPQVSFDDGTEVWLEARCHWQRAVFQIRHAVGGTPGESGIASTFCIDDLGEHPSKTWTELAAQRYGGDEGTNRDLFKLLIHMGHE